MRRMQSIDVQDSDSDPNFKVSGSHLAGCRMGGGRRVWGGGTQEGEARFSKIKPMSVSYCSAVQSACTTGHCTCITSMRHSTSMCFIDLTFVSPGNQEG